MIRRFKKGGLRDISVIDPPWENPHPVWKCRDGAYTIVKCDTQWDYQLEGYFLAHCLGTKDYDEFSKAHVVYSLRDDLRIPHATILCVREGMHSPYGGGWDIGSNAPFFPEELPPADGPQGLRILQVRGRHDVIAMAVFHSYVRDWYTKMGGRIQVDIHDIVGYLLRAGDDDITYHFRYLMDESRNAFQWAHYNERERTRARMNGTSL